MTWLTVILATLAVYRLAHLIALEDGPWRLAFYLRRWVYRTFKGNENGESWQFAGITCPLCISFWLAWPASLWLRPPSWTDWALYSLGLAGAVLVLHKALSRL